MIRWISVLPCKLLTTSTLIYYVECNHPWMLNLSRPVQREATHHLRAKYAEGVCWPGQCSTPTPLLFPFKSLNKGIDSPTSSKVTLGPNRNKAELVADQLISVFALGRI